MYILSDGRTIVLLLLQISFVVALPHELTKERVDNIDKNQFVAMVKKIREGVQRLMSGTDSDPQHKQTEGSEDAWYSSAIEWIKKRADFTGVSKNDLKDELIDLFGNIRLGNKDTGLQDVPPAYDAPDCDIPPYDDMPVTEPSKHKEDSKLGIDDGTKFKKASPGIDNIKDVDKENNIGQAIKPGLDLDQDDTKKSYVKDLLDNLDQFIMENGDENLNVDKTNSNVPHAETDILKNEKPSISTLNAKGENYDSLGKNKEHKTEPVSSHSLGDTAVHEEVIENNESNKSKNNIEDIENEKELKSEYHSEDDKNTSPQVDASEDKKENIKRKKILRVQNNPFPLNSETKEDDLNAFYEENAKDEELLREPEQINNVNEDSSDDEEYPEGLEEVVDETYSEYRGKSKKIKSKKKNKKDKIPLSDVETDLIAKNKKAKKMEKKEKKQRFVDDL